MRGVEQDFNTHDAPDLIKISLQPCSLCSRILGIGKDSERQSAANCRLDVWFFRDRICRVETYACPCRVSYFIEANFIAQVQRGYLFNSALSKCFLEDLAM
jgi:hypothetical protein